MGKKYKQKYRKITWAYSRQATSFKLEFILSIFCILTPIMQQAGFNCLSLDEIIKLKFLFLKVLISTFVDNNSVRYVCCRICEKVLVLLKNTPSGRMENLEIQKQKRKRKQNRNILFSEIEFGTMLLLHKTYLLLLLLLGRDNTGELVEMWVRVINFWLHNLCKTKTLTL